MTSAAPTFEAGELVPVGRPRKVLARDALALYDGRKNLFVKELRAEAAASRDWLPTDLQAKLIFHLMSKRLIARAEAEGFEFDSDRQAATAAWMEMAALQRGERKKVKRQPWES